MRYRPRTQVEPLIPEQEQQMDLRTAGPRAFHTHRPPFDELFDRLFCNFRQNPEPKNKNVRHLNVVIILTPEQAFQGGQIKVTLPAQFHCPSCSGHVKGPLPL
jgi:DnaJ-class molecular chaperone